MAFPAPGWATYELAEEWPESSPSPPPAQPVDLPPIPQPRYDAESVRAKRGSLRMLGTASARPLPPSRSASSASNGDGKMRIVSGHVDEGRGHISSFSHGIDTGLPSPPSSRSSSGSGPGPKEDIGGAGTCVVKEGVEDNRGQHLARNPMGPKGGKDIFGALPLERMFDPPSPPLRVQTHDQPQEIASTSPPEHMSSTPIATPTPAAINHARRTSHPYAPANPSRLSKSVTPSSNDSFTTISSAAGSLAPTPVLEHDGFDEPDSLIRDSTILHDEEEQDDESNAAKQEDGANTKSARLGEMTLRSGEVETDMSPFNRRGSGDYPFTFNAPRHPSTSSPDPGRSERSIFDPDLDAGGEGPSHSTLHFRHKPTPAPLQMQAPRGVSQQSSNPGLRLFRSTYDTYTREHLSALVDSIAIEPSPSPPTNLTTRGSRDWEPAAEGSISPSTSGSRSTPSGSSLSSDARSSKRLRLSPPSPPRRNAGLRDWGAQGRAMMDKIRGRDAGEETTTSVSRSQTADTDEHDRDLDGGPTVDYAALPPTPPQEVIETRQEPVDRRTHRSNPSTTSSGYLRAAEDIMARIKQRKVSESASGVENSPVAIGGRRVLSESDENQMWEEGAKRYSKTKGKGKTGPSPRRMLRRLSASEEIKRVVEGHSGSGSEEEQERPLSAHSHSGPRRALEERRPTSRAEGTSSSGAQPELQAQSQPAPFNADDLNRFMSSSTHATTTTTMSTSFVKHRGPRAAAGPGSGMRMIRPDDVQGVVPDRIGKMRFDRAGMRWVREELGPVDEAGESRAGGSEESVDVFAGMESLPDDGMRNGTLPRQQQPQHQFEGEISIFSSTTTSENESIVVQDAAPTHVNEEQSASETGSESDVDEPTEMPQPQAYTHATLDITSPHRPLIHHVASAPAVMTPTPSAHAPRPMRSALRNGPTPAAFKKRAGWSDEATPAGSGRGVTPASSGKRSVSFSDGKKAGKIVGLEVEITTTKWSTSTGEGNLFKEDTGENSRGFLPSARTNRIKDLLEDMEEMSLEDETPSKPSRQSQQHNDRPSSPPSPAHSSASESTVPIISFRGGRSFARAHTPRNPGDATFLTDCSFGVTHDKLVELITDVQPFEPHWEQLKSIDLKGKGADSVARLKEFLPLLDEANLDDNAISYLSGIPSSVRTLHVAGNKLTSLTSVNHLRNLQYLDISRNQLDSVAQLGCLKHLRELKMDNNTVTDLSGIMNMDCLIKLSCANNDIETLDLSQAKWSKMETLNLANNRIKSVRDLHKLASIASINFDGNQLEHLAPSRPMISVRVLRFSENDLRHFDLSLFPKVRTLYADGNRLSQLSRSSTCSSSSGRLENLSLRNQRISSASTFKLSYRDLENVKRLYLSGNSLSKDFFPSKPLYALVYLEAAACRLASWPAGLGFANNMPNLKVLNVNYNHLPNLDGVKGLKGLRKLTLVGGRLGSDAELEGGHGHGRGVLEGLKGLECLEEVDFRMNPSTLSYYFPLLLPSSTSAASALDPSSAATITTGSSNGAPSAVWASYDSRFRKNLPDEWYSKRMVYRGLVMRTCPLLKKLDGVVIEDGERRKAGLLLDAALRRR
ncbi:hypothetical protein I316_05096 [Kwoniella heveanensis BCC8398]|uniref:Leucine repeat containing protein n=1 Tax=Kwoniella heveanensis BCC8398 TaxID=1296120 RepID=A0A1B9GQH1_9TREE|nr:hypothetical protein I316_05096 [Kwoniella heveanensis BCC8398]